MGFVKESGSRGVLTARGIRPGSKVEDEAFRQAITPQRA
jgi:hypothetical protein